MNKELLEVVKHASQKEHVQTVLYVASHGSRNYGLYQEGESDRDYTVFFMPTQDKLLFTGPLRARQVVMSNEVEYKLFDVRNLLSNMDKANLSSVDFLWAKHEYVHPSAQPLFEWLHENSFYLLKSRNVRLSKAHMGQFYSLQKKETEPKPKALVQSFYFLQLSSLLLDTKTPKRFYSFAKQGNLWNELFGTPDLMEVKFSKDLNTSKVSELMERTKKVFYDLETRTESMEDKPLDQNRLYLKLKREMTKLLLNYF